MVTDFYWPFVGGVERRVRSLSTELVAHGHEVAVVTLWWEGLAAFELDQGVRVYRIKGTMQRMSQLLFSHPERTWAPPFPDSEGFWTLRQIVTRERPDMVADRDGLFGASG